MFRESAPAVSWSTPDFRASMFSGSFIPCICCCMPSSVWMDAVRSASSPSSALPASVSCPAIGVRVCPTFSRVFWIPWRSAMSCVPSRAFRLFRSCTAATSAFACCRAAIWASICVVSTWAVAAVAAAFTVICLSAGSSALAAATAC